MRAAVHACNFEMAADFLKAQLGEGDFGIVAALNIQTR